jgi:hypothetical protein
MKMKATVTVVDANADPEAKPMWSEEVDFSDVGASVVVGTSTGSATQAVSPIDAVVTIKLNGVVPEEVKETKAEKKEEAHPSKGKN